MDYIDILMMHWPNPDQDRFVDALRGLGRLLEAGDIRAIGVSNFKPAHLRRVIEETDVVPDINQIQLSPYHAAHRVPGLQRRAAASSPSPGARSVPPATSCAPTR